MKIGFFEIEPWEQKILTKEFPKDNLVFSSQKLTKRNLNKYKNLEAITLFVHSKIDKDTLTKLPHLKLITTMSTGFDHINLEECQRKRITVCNVPHYGENTVAEQTFALILALSRKIIECSTKVHLGEFRPKGLRGFDLQNKTLGVVGGGNIGQHVIRIAKGFDMKVLVFDIYQDKKLAKKLGFRYTKLDKLLQESDIITLHLPLNKHTTHLINQDRLSLMKPSAYLINTSRGGVIDTHALIKALNKKQLAGAALDVLENECDIVEETQLVKKGFKCDLKTLEENHLLLKLPQVLITPHNAFNTHEAMRRILDTTIKNIKSFKKGKKINQIIK